MAMDMTGVETLLGPVGASPLDMEPLTTGCPSNGLSSDDDGHTLLFLPLWWGSRRWGFWTVVKGAATLAVCAAVLYALRRCLRRRRVAPLQGPLQEVETPVPPPLSPHQVGKWTIVPSTPTLAKSPPPLESPPTEIKSPPTEDSSVAEVSMNFGIVSDDEAEPSIDPPSADLSRKPLVSETEEFNLTFTADALQSDTVQNGDNALQSDTVQNGDNASNVPVSDGRADEVAMGNNAQPNELVTSKAMVTIL